MSNTITKLVAFIKNVISDSSKHKVATFAASTSFFFFLSLFPTIILLCALIPYTPLELEYVTSAIDDLVPEMVRPLLISIITSIYLRSAGTITISALTTLWSAGRGITELVSAINAINDYQEKRGYLKLRVFSSLYTLIMLFMFGASLIVLVFGRRLIKSLLLTPGLEKVYEGLRQILHFQYIFAFGVVLLMFLLLFSKLPAVKSPLKKNLPGAIFSTLLWLGFTYLFSVFLGIYNPFSAYGTLATTIILMLWMYFCIYFLILGAVVNKCVTGDVSC